MKKLKIEAIYIHSFLLIISLIILVPIIFTFLTSLKYFKDIISGSLIFTPTLVNYKQLFNITQSNFPRLTLNSMIAGSGTAVVVILIASLAAYGLTRFKWLKLWKSIIMGWLLVVNMLPPITFIGPFYLITQRAGVYNTPIAVIMGHLVLCLPLASWILFDFFIAVPKELEEAALIDGATRIQIFARVLMPIIKPGVAAATVLVFLFSWRDFIFALSLTSTSTGMTIPVGIASFVQEYQIRYGAMAAAAFFAAFPALIMVILAQRYIIKGMTLGALKG